MEKVIKYQGVTANTNDANCQDGDMTVAINVVAEESGMIPFAPPSVIMDLPVGKLLLRHSTAQYEHWIVERKFMTTSDAALQILEMRQGIIRPESYYMSTSVCLYTDDSTLAFSDRYTDIVTFPRGSEVHEVTAIGNSLVILTDSGVHYAVWDYGNSRYNYLGTKPPELDIRMSVSDPLCEEYDASTIPAQGLSLPDTDPQGYYTNYRNKQTPIRKYTKYAYRQTSLNTHGIVRDGVDSTIVGGDAEAFTNAVWSLINSANHTISDNGHFYAPFFVRYCYRLYDGTMYMHSVPIFINVKSPFSYMMEAWPFFFDYHGTMQNPLDYSDSKYNFKVDFYDKNGDDDYSFNQSILYESDKICLIYHANSVALRYTLKHLQASIADQLEGWKDIIDSVDFFVSSPMVREKGEANIEQLDKRYFQYNLTSAGYQEERPMDRHLWDLPYNYRATVAFPMEDEGNYLQRLSDVAAFYKIASIPIDDFVADIRNQVLQKNVPIKKGILPLLSTQEQMVDDYKTHSYLLPVYDKDNKCLTSFYNYNARLNVACVKEQLTPFPWQALMPYITSSKEYFAEEKVNQHGVQTFGQYLNDCHCTSIVVTLKTNEGYKYLRYESSQLGTQNPLGSEHISFQRLMGEPIFFPDTRAVEMSLKIQFTCPAMAQGTNTIVVKLKMKPSSFLNASVTQPMVLPSPISLSLRAIPATYTDIVTIPQGYYPFLKRGDNQEMFDKYFLADRGVSSTGMAMQGYNGYSTLTYKVSYTLTNQSMDFTPAMDIYPSILFESEVFRPNRNNTLPVGNSYSNKPTVTYTNKIYTSEIENPFFFPANTINTVGSGTVLGMAAAAKALSQGQFGSHPVYAFTDEGIWALSVSSTGGFSTIQPLSRDVIIDKSTITQMDSAVLFITKRGIMLVSGSTVKCISDALQAKRNFNVYQDLPKAFELLELAGFSDARTLYNQGTYICPVWPFLSFIQEARMLYVYSRQIIIVYRPDQRLSYVYSIPTAQWTMVYHNSPITHHIPSYPDAIAMRSIYVWDSELEQSRLVSRVYNYSNDRSLYDDNASEIRVNGLILTRPLNMGVPNVHKTITRIIQRGNFDKGDLRVALYASRDLRNWIYISSSKDHYLRGFYGTPYKYFRMAVLFDLTADESMYAASVEFDERLTNQPR